jgi:hypothetical protein
MVLSPSIGTTVGGGFFALHATRRHATRRPATIGEGARLTP